jgi:hypothetical protein
MGNQKDRNGATNLMRKEEEENRDGAAASPWMDL